VIEPNKLDGSSGLLLVQQRAFFSFSLFGQFGHSILILDSDTHAGLPVHFAISRNNFYCLRIPLFEFYTWMVFINSN
jgi:hypothetical protein